MEGTFFLTKALGLLSEGKLIIDLYNLMIEQGWAQDVVIATPNITLRDVQREMQKEEFNSIANAENLDLSVLFMGITNGKEVVTDRWELGWDDGTHQTVIIYTKEFFALPDSWKLFAKWVTFRLRVRTEEFSQMMLKLYGIVC
jgi:hypothetical protein